MDIDFLIHLRPCISVFLLETNSELAGCYTPSARIELSLFLDNPLTIIDVLVVAAELPLPIDHRFHLRLVCQSHRRVDL